MDAEALLRQPLIRYANRRFYRHEVLADLPAYVALGREHPSLSDMVADMRRTSDPFTTLHDAREFLLQMRRVLGDLEPCDDHETVVQSASAFMDEALALVDTHMAGEAKYWAGIGVYTLQLAGQQSIETVVSSAPARRQVKRHVLPSRDVAEQRLERHISMLDKLFSLTERYPHLCDDVDLPPKEATAALVSLYRKLGRQEIAQLY